MGLSDPCPSWEPTDGRREASGDWPLDELLVKPVACERGVDPPGTARLPWGTADPRGDTGLLSWAMSDLLT